METIGGYVTVPRHVIDFSSKTAVEAVLADLAAQYAIEPEPDSHD